MRERVEFGLPHFRSLLLVQKWVNDRRSGALTFSMKTTSHKPPRPLQKQTLSIVSMYVYVHISSHHLSAVVVVLFRSHLIFSLKA